MVLYIRFVLNGFYLTNKNATEQLLLTVEIRFFRTLAELNMTSDTIKTMYLF